MPSVSHVTCKDTVLRVATEVIILLSTSTSKERSHFDVIKQVISISLLLDYIKPAIMVKELSYATISHVMETWEQLRRTKDYEENAGRILFQK